MMSSKYRLNLPQMGQGCIITDGGVETTLIFQDGLDLPLFAAFTLFESAEGRQALRRYYERYIAIARERNIGFILDSATWRANRNWGERLGYGARALADANRAAVSMLFELRETHEASEPFVVSGNIGPRGDGYAADTIMSPAEAAEYHGDQVATFEAAGVDMISAITMTHSGEAAGIARASARRGVPLALAFTVETDGRLPSGQPLVDAIREVDTDPSGGPTYYMINCAHPDHFRSVLEPGAAWVERIRGLRANASRLSHSELDEAEELDTGDPLELASDYQGLLKLMPNLRVFGGCCGTDHRHVGAIAQTCVPVRAF